MKDIQDIDIDSFEWIRKLNSSIGQSMLLISLSTMLIDWELECMDWWNDEGIHNHFGGIHQKKDNESNKW